MSSQQTKSTIVVLLILAGISINLIMGDDGTIKKAQGAKNSMNEAEESELSALNNLNNYVNQVVENVTKNAQGETEPEAQHIKVSSITLSNTSTWMDMEATLILIATISPADAENKEVEWTSSNTNVATVDQSGSVSAVGTGYATITATAKDGSGISSSCNINVVTACFVAGTKVLTEDGLKPIESIKEGEKVYTINMDNNSRELKEVNKTIQTASNDIYKLTINNKIVETTPRHQFYVVDKGWVRAYDLRVGDKIASKDDKECVISNIDLVRYDKPITVYNLSVEGNHNYFVTDIELFVHNSPV